MTTDQPTPGDAADTNERLLHELRGHLHELRVHQIELEIQNEELRRSQRETEAARSRCFKLYDLAPGAHCTLDAHGKIAEANASFADLLQRHRAVLVGRPFTDFIAPVDQDHYYFLRRRLAASQEPQVCVLKLQRRGASPCWVKLDARNDRDDEGAPVCRVGLSDITDQQEGTERLSELSDFRLAMLDALPSRVAAVDREGKVTWVNRAWRAPRAGRAPGPAVGDQYGEGEAAITDVLAGRASEFRGQRAIPGEPTVTVLVRALDGDARGAVVCEEDVTLIPR